MTQKQELALATNKLPVTEVPLTDLLSQIKVYKVEGRNCWVIDTNQTEIAITASAISLFTSGNIVLKTMNGDIAMNPILKPDGTPIKVLQEAKEFLNLLGEVNTHEYILLVSPYVLEFLAGYVLQENVFTKVDDTYYVWRDDDKSITVKLVDDKVVEAEFHLGDILFATFGKTGLQNRA